MQSVLITSNVVSSNPDFGDVFALISDQLFAE
jgi:hypothetical protein